MKQAGYNLLQNLYKGFFMSNPVTDAFFLGRALAEVLNEKIEESLTNVVSEFGKFDAEQREHLREFLAEVETRAQRDKETQGATSSSSAAENPSDLQETIDDLRAEIARLKAELKNYRDQSL